MCKRRMGCCDPCCETSCCDPCSSAPCCK
jgi:hypothetical protein